MNALFLSAILVCVDFSFFIGQAKLALVSSFLVIPETITKNSLGLANLVITGSLPASVNERTPLVVIRGSSDLVFEKDWQPQPFFEPLGGHDPFKDLYIIRGLFDIEEDFPWKG